MNPQPRTTHLGLVGCTIAAIWAATATLVVVGGLGGGVTLAVLAYAASRGALHALDADHLSMIDNSTRRLLAQQRATPSLGLAFSLGHSTVVLAAGCAVIAGAHWVITATTDGSDLARTLGLIGASVSVIYLTGVAVANLPLLWRSAHRHPHTHTVRGPLTRVLAAPFGQVDRPWQVYLVGVLFGLGFDTASTISVLMLAAAATGASPWTLLAIPVVFTAAMTTGDSINSLLMLHVYRDAQHLTPRLSKVIVAVSVTSALAIAAITTAGIISELGGWQLPWAEVDTTVIAGALLTMAVLGGIGFGLWRIIHHQPQQRATA